MIINYYSKTCTFTPAMVEMAEKKFAKLEKFLKEGEPIKLVMENFKEDHTRLKVQIVLKNNKRIRTEVDEVSYYSCLDEALENLKIQAKEAKDKTTRKERCSKSEFDMPEIVEPTIKKRKHFDLEDSITEGMAMIEMEKLGHDKYVFRNINEEDKICVLYKRMDVDFSLIVID